VEDILAMKDLEYLLAGWIVKGGIGLVVGDSGAGKSFLVFDLLLHLAYGMNDDENATAFAARLSALTKVAAGEDRPPATGIGVHHNNREGGFHGSGFFLNNFDFMITMERKCPEGTPLTKSEMRLFKDKDGEPGKTLLLEFLRIELGAIPGAATSLVIDAVTEGEFGARGDERKDTKADRRARGAPHVSLKDVTRDDCRDMLRFIQAKWDEGEPLSPHRQAKGRYAPPKLVHFFGVTFDQAEQLIEKWMDTDILVLREFDGHSKEKGLKVVGSIDEIISDEKL
jgi:hypothetical protein